MKLFQHQRETIDWLKSKNKAIVAHEMGLGKTRIAIQSLIEKQKIGSVLVVCPASLKINWKREIQMALDDCGVDGKIIVINSGKEIEIVGTEHVTKWIVINYDMIQKYIGQLNGMALAGEISAIIVDEAHYIKGKSTIRARAVMSIIENIETVYMLTGTPIMNRPIELYNLLKSVKHPVADKRTVYAKKYCDAHLKTLILKNGRMLRFIDESGASRLPELRELIKDVFIRMMKKDVLNLPPKIISIRKVELTKEQKREYDTTFDAYVDWVLNNPDEGKDIENIMTAQHLVELSKLKQVCSRAKIKTIISDIENAIESEQKVIVFSQFTKTIEMIADEARTIQYETGECDGFGKPKKKNVEVVTLTGQDKMIDRQKSVDAFQNNPDVKVFVANIKAGGVGLNLTSASMVVFADMEWSPEIHSQAEDRAHRIGQTGTVNIIYYVIEDTIEEDIVDILGRKKEIIKTVVEGKELDSMEQSMAKEFMGRLQKKLVHRSS